MYMYDVCTIIKSVILVHNLNKYYFLTDNSSIAYVVLMNNSLVYNYCERSYIHIEYPVHS